MGRSKHAPTANSPGQRESPVKNPPTKKSPLPPKDLSRNPAPFRFAWLWGLLGLGGLLAAAWWFGSGTFVANGAPGEKGGGKGKPSAVEAISFDARASYKLLTDLCKIGPRPSGSAGMAEQQEILTRLFAERGGKVSRQEFRIRHPIQGTAVTLANLVVEFHPDRKERILLCAHYDTRPFPDMDPKKPRGIFVGANDGASGAALLAEMARDLAAIPGKIGVDVVLFPKGTFQVPRRERVLMGTDPGWGRSY